MSKRGKTTIELMPETRDRLRDAKRGAETYDALILRLLRIAEEVGQ